jgi:retinol-binding protein 3
MTPTIREFQRAAIAALVVTIVSSPAASQPMERRDFAVTPAERQAVLEGAVAKLNAYYVYPETARQMEQALRARIDKGEYASIVSARALADKLTADLREVSRDKHLHVMYNADGVRDDAKNAAPSARQYEEARAWLQKVNFGFEKVERLRGNIGYVDIRGFVPPRIGGETASAAMTFVAHTDALIVDLRQNHGGEPAMIAYVLSYLFDEPTHLNDIYERPTDTTQQWWTAAHVPGQRFGGDKPVYVLTSSQTFSGGEEFAYNLKNLKRATLIGETTGGGAHPVQAYKVSEHFAIGVPFARAISPVTRTNWEGTGVAPDVAVAADKALETAVRMALEAMRDTSTDPQHKAQIEKLLSERRSGS